MGAFQTLAFELDRTMHSQCEALVMRVADLAAYSCRNASIGLSAAARRAGK